jgi:hypothetical protein
MSEVGSETLSHPLSPLEDFVRTYLETVGGVWDEVEPQVYDVLLPVAESGGEAAGEMLRMTFDPEALPEHPGAQLASFGTPLIDRLLNDAVRRGRTALFYLTGLNLAPHDLAGRVRRSLTLTPPLVVRVERVRALDFAQVVFWFQAEFVSDQKEQEILPVAIDLHYGREVRHIDQLLDRSRLLEEPALLLPEARRSAVATAYPGAREQVLRSLAPMAGVRHRELAERLERQVARMRRYYADLRDELAEQRRRTHDKEDATERLEARQMAIDREEQVRVAELRQKSALRVHLRLLQMVMVQQPKLLVHTLFTVPGREPNHLELVWDPLLEMLEAVSCPECGRPTYALEATRLGRVVCPACAARAAEKPSRTGRR